MIKFRKEEMIKIMLCASFFMPVQWAIAMQENSPENGGGAAIAKSKNSKHKNKQQQGTEDSMIKSQESSAKTAKVKSEKLKAETLKDKKDKEKTTISQEQWDVWLENSQQQFGVGVSGKIEEKINILDKSNLLDDPGGVLAEEELDEGI